MKAFTIEIDSIDRDTFRVLFGAFPEDWDAMTDEQREAAGWVRVPEDDPDYDMDYCAWRQR